MHPSINADQLLRSLALSIARNNVGAQLPLHAVLASEGLVQSEYDDISTNPQFQTYVTQYEAELKESGFSFAAKSRVLAEDLLPTAYHMARDPDVPAATRAKMIENLVDWGDLKPKNSSLQAQGPGFSITFNIPSLPQNGQKTVVLEAESTGKPVDSDQILTISDATPKNRAPAVPTTFAEPEDYEYAGDDVL